MGPIAFSIDGAAEAAGVERLDIEDAIRARTLVARQLRGQPVITAAALTAWVETLPDWFATARGV